MKVLDPNVLFMSFFVKEPAPVVALDEDVALSAIACVDKVKDDLLSQVCAVSGCGIVKETSSNLVGMVLVLRLLGGSSHNYAISAAVARR